jgi:WD40 repeat protein
MSNDKQLRLRVRAPDGSKEARVEAAYPFLVEVWPSGGKRPLCCNPRHDSGVEALAWSPDSTRIATADWRHRIQIWNGVTGDTIAFYRQVDDVVNTLAWSPDGSLVAIGSHAPEVYILDAAAGMPVAGLSAHDGPVQRIVFSLDSRRLASACLGGFVYLWRLFPSELIACYPLRTEVISALAYSPDGQRLAALCEDGAVHVLACYEKLWRGKWSVAPLSCSGALAWSPDGESLGIDWGEGEQFYDARTGREREPVGTAGQKSPQPGG